jgi:hypothetical protein
LLVCISLSLRHHLNYLRIFRTLTRRFHISRGRHVIIYYDPKVASHFYRIADIIGLTDACVDELSSLFGFGLRRKLVVFVFLNARALSPFLGRPSQGAAFIGADALALIAQPRGASLPAILRHELTHLFAAYLNSASPGINQEGVAMAIESLFSGMPLDDLARAAVLSEPDLSLAKLLRFKSTNIESGDKHYVVFGSFTLYLIRRYGWQQYLSYYSLGRGDDCEKALSQVFCSSIGALEADWRASLKKGV